MITLKNVAIKFYVGKKLRPHNFFKRIEQLVSESYRVIQIMCECKTMVQSSITAPDRAAQIEGKKSVRFSGQPPKTVLFYKEDSCWFDQDIFRRNKKACAEQGKAWQEKGYSILLEDVFESPSRERLDVYVQLPGNDYVRGMENYLSNDLKKERSAKKSLVIQSVIDREIQMKLEGIHSREQIAQELAVISLNHSNQARDFAKRLGMADELACRLGENPELPRFVLGTSAPYLMAKKDLSSWSLPGSSGLSWIVSSVTGVIGGRQA